MKSIACTITGHRPMKFTFGYDEEDHKCIRLKLAMAGQINALIQSGISVFYTGMAQGVDQWGADIVLATKRRHPHVRLIAVLPCETQANRWSPQQRERYFDILACCDNVIMLSAHYTRQCMRERNRYMVDHADVLLAVYDGGPKGGTAHTVHYAQRKNRRIIIIRPDTLLISAAKPETLKSREG
jgi:uncharacterized phage-like protein YoqJ